MLDLKKFCDPLEARSYLHTPWHCEAGFVAANGHILVCTKTPATTDHEIADNPATKAANRWAASLPHLLELADQWNEVCAVLLPTERPCPICEPGRAYHDCYQCLGHGIQHQSVLVEGPAGSSWLSSVYLQWLRDLPNCRIRPSGAEAAFFVFDGGWGALMPRQVHVEN